MDAKFFLTLNKARLKLVNLNTIQDFIEHYKSVLSKSGDYPILQAYFMGFVDGLIIAKIITERSASVEILKDKMVLHLDEDEKTL